MRYPKPLVETQLIPSLHLFLSQKLPETLIDRTAPRATPDGYRVHQSPRLGNPQGCAPVHQEFVERA